MMMRWICLNDARAAALLFSEHEQERLNSGMIVFVLLNMCVYVCGKEEV